MRDPYFDNAKFILIVLVVIGHATPHIEGSVFMSLLGMAIYTFHMPLFAFISGYFAKDMIFSKRGLQLVAKYLLIYLVYEMICGFIFVDLIGFLLSPRTVAWYLLSLVTWYLLLPLFSRKAYLIIPAFVLSLLIGDAGFGYFLSLSRTFTFLPFFVAGYHFGRLKLNIPNNNYLIIFIPIIAILLYRFYGINDFGRLFDALEARPVAHRLLHTAVVVVSGFCFMSIVPKGRTFFTPLGKSTLQIFLLHWPVLLFMQYSGVFNSIDTPVEYLLLLAWCGLLSIALSYSPFKLSVRTASYSEPPKLKPQRKPATPAPSELSARQ